MKTRRHRFKPTADIVVIGMAGFFPDPPDLAACCVNIVKGAVAIGEISTARWNWRSYCDTIHLAEDKINSKWGRFLPDDLFDPLKFGIPLNAIETTQLLDLESTRQAQVDAGFADCLFNRAHTWVSIGTGAGEAGPGLLYSFNSLMPHFFGDSAADILHTPLADQHADAIRVRTFGAVHETMPSAGTIEQEKTDHG